jgi:fibronectin type 3 domain-containing protein
MPYFAKDGDTVVRATSDYPLLAVYSVKRTNGTLTLLVINKSSSSNLTAAINLTGFLPVTNATVYSYGIPQDTAAETGVGSPDIAQTNLAGVQSSFSVAFAPFSATVMVLSAGNQPPFTPSNVVATVSNVAVALTWSAASGADSYLIKRSTTSGGGYTTIASGVTATSYLDTGLVNGTIYYYVVAATNAYGVSSNSAEASATPLIKFVGTVIGSPGSWGNYDKTIANVFDGNTNTFYDAVNGTGDWAGLDLGSGAAAIVMQIRYCPRAGFASRMLGGRFQGANVADFSNGVVTLFTVASTPPEGVLTVQFVTNAASFRYLRYIGPAGGYCNVAEVEFWGRNVVIPLSAPTGLAAVAGNGSVALSWSASATATDYYVKRSTMSGSAYTTVATNTSLMFTNIGLNNGTAYYYVVSALNSSGESTNSTEVSATPLAPPAAPTGLAATVGNSTVALSWSATATATNYYVKRSLTTGSAFTTIATNASLTFTNTGLTNGTLYYFVVSAANASGEGANSTEVGARPTSFSPTQLSFARTGNQFELNWPADHTGWQLQSQTNSLPAGLGTNWVNVTGSEQTNHVVWPMNAADGAVFFRLVSP